MERVKLHRGRVYAVANDLFATTETAHPPPSTLAYLQGALNATDAVVYTIDCSFRITMVNGAWDRFAMRNGGAGLLSDCVVGTNLLDGITGPRREELRSICESIFRGELERYEFEADISSPNEQRICQITITPLRATHHEIIGAVFTSHDITHYKALLQAVAEQRQQLQSMLASLRQREVRARILQRTAEALNSTRTLAGTLRVIAEAAVSETDVQAAIVYIVSGDGQQLVPVSSCGIDTGSRTSKTFWLESSLARSVLESGHMLVVEDTTQHRSLAFPVLQTGMAHAVAALPIRGPEGIKGVLEVYSSQAGAFDSDHVALLQVLADQSASAIRNAQNVERERRTTRLLRLLNKVSANLAGELDVQAIVRFVTEALVEQLGMAYARVWLYDERVNALVLRSSSGMQSDVNRQYNYIKLGQSTIGQIAENRRSVVSNNVQIEPGVVDTSWAVTAGIRSFAGYPLVVRDRLLGVLAFFGRAPLDREQLTVMEPLVYQVAVAVERALLYVSQVAARREAQHLAHLAGTRAAQLSATLAAMSDGVWTCDINGRILTINDAALAMFGCDAEELRIEHVDDIGSLFDEDSSDPDACLGLRSALAGRTVKRELVLHSHNNSEMLIVAFVATPMRDVGGNVCGAVAVVRDITQQRAMERLKDDFLTIAAHELKTPVTAIKGYAQLALSRMQADAEPTRLRRALNTIDQQAERIAHLVEELLDMSRIQAGQLHLQRKQVDLVALARRSIEQVQQEGTQHQFVLHAPPHLHGCWDEARVEQVLQNLLGNAMKYSPEGGCVTTTIAVLDDVVHVTVRDQGIGIPPEKQPRIFEPWFQAHTDTSGDYGGMGLGLSISKEIVQRHDGKMWLESKQDEGSMFGFTLPLQSGS